MLVLSRQRDEKVILDFSKATQEEMDALLSGERIVEVTVVAIRGDEVRLGIDAARSVQVHRYEIWKEIQQQKEAQCASQSPESKA